MNDQEKERDTAQAAGGGDVRPPETETSAPEGAPGDQLRRELDEALKSAQTYKDQFLRKAAEFENYKRRSETEYLSMVRNANEGLMGALLPIVEDLTRSLKAGNGQADGEAFYRGVDLIYQKLMKILETRGLAPFESSGKPFDVDYHDALLQVPRDDVPPGTVVEEIARGYKLNDKVLRHAKVIVSTASQPESSPQGSVEPGTTGESKESTPH
jgi:molecular chaperone GrpE